MRSVGPWYMTQTWTEAILVATYGRPMIQDSDMNRCHFSSHIHWIYEVITIAVQYKLIHVLIYALCVYVSAYMFWFMRQLWTESDACKDIYMYIYKHIFLLHIHTCIHTYIRAGADSCWSKWGIQIFTSYTHIYTYILTYVWYIHIHAGADSFCARWSSFHHRSSLHIYVCIYTCVYIHIGIHTYIHACRRW
jgi:hypothetical protein